MWANRDERYVLHRWSPHGKEGIWECSNSRRTLRTRPLKVIEFIMFEESELSDTVLEFRAYSRQSSFSKLSAVAGALFVIFLLGSLWVRCFDDVIS